MGAGVLKVKRRTPRAGETCAAVYALSVGPTGAGAAASSLYRTGEMMAWLTRWCAELVCYWVMVVMVMVARLRRTP